MSAAPFASLTVALERELEGQRSLAPALDAALAAAAARDLARLEPSLGALDAASRRARAQASERQNWVSRLAPRAAAPSLRDLAALPGAPADRWHRLREELRAAADAVAARVRRLQPLVRDLGELHALALASLLPAGAAGVRPGSPLPSHGSLLDTQA